MSLLLGVSEATLDLLVPIQSLGSLFDSPWAGLEFQVSRWKYISEGSELCQEYFGLLYSLFGIYSFPSGTSPSLDKITAKMLVWWAKKVFQLGFSIQGSWLVSRQVTGWEGVPPNLKCSWYPLLPDPPHSSTSYVSSTNQHLMLASFENGNHETEPALIVAAVDQKVFLKCQPSHCWAVTWRYILRGGLSWA